MRILAILLLALPLLAEEPEKPAPEKKNEQIDELVAALTAQMKDADPEVRAKLIEELKRVLGDGIGVASVDMRFGAPGIKVALRGHGGETMSGSWKENGKTGTYTLKSLKNGIYELNATLDGSETTATKGTLAELRKKYPFLKEFMFITPFAFRLDPEGETGLAIDVSRPGLVGIRTHPPSEALRHHLELVAGAGLVIDTVLPGSRAEKMGLRRFDILMRIDGEVVEDRKQIKRLNEPGVTLEYVRRAKAKRLVTPE